MTILSKAVIAGVGVYLPEKRLTNTDLERMVDTTDEWIVQRTGVRERRISGKQEYASDLAIGAVENLVSQGISVKDVDLILVTTFTPDHFTPTVSAMVQGHFGMPRAGTMDIGAGCTGFVYALCVADSMMAAGHCRKALVIAAETISKAVDYTDRSTCPLFGDAGVACLLEPARDRGFLLGSFFSTDGDMGENVTCGNYSDTIGSQKLKRPRIFNQAGQAVYKYVVQKVPEGVKRLLEGVGIALKEVDWFVPHSANLRIVEAVCGKLGFPIEKTLTSLEYHGNTSSATIPLSLWLAGKRGLLKSGQKLLLYGFGGGLTHGGVVLEL